MFSRGLRVVAPRCTLTIIVAPRAGSCVAPRTGYIESQFAPRRTPLHPVRGDCGGEFGGECLGAGCGQRDGSIEGAFDLGSEVGRPQFRVVPVGHGNRPMPHEPLEVEDGYAGVRQHGRARRPQGVEVDSLAGGVRRAAARRRPPLNAGQLEVAVEGLVRGDASRTASGSRA